MLMQAGKFTRRGQRYRHLLRCRPDAVRQTFPSIGDMQQHHTLFLNSRDASLLQAPFAIFQVVPLAIHTAYISCPSARR